MHGCSCLGLQALIDQQWPGVSWTAMLWETAINAAAAWSPFMLTDALPSAMARGRMSRRSSLSRRQW